MREGRPEEERAAMMEGGKARMVGRPALATVEGLMAAVAMAVGKARAAVGMGKVEVVMAG